MGRMIETDVLVIGTGPIGSTYARLAGARGRKVTMIDIGPQLRKRPGEHLLNCYRYQHEPNLSMGEMFANREVYSIPGVPNDLSKSRLGGGSYMPPLERLNFQNPEQNPSFNMPNAAFMYAVGGMFSLWSGFAPDPAPMERTPLISDSEWEHILHVAHELLNVHIDTFEPSAAHRAISSVLDKAGHSVQGHQMGAEKRKMASPHCHYVNWTGSDTILGPLLDAEGGTAENLDILEEHRAEKLVMKGSRIDHALVRDLKTLELFEFHASNFVVAGGAFLTPRLLWQSGIRPPALGRYLHENPVATCEIALNEAVIKALKEDPNNPARSELIPIARNDAPPKFGFEVTPDRPWMSHFNRTGREITYDFPTDVRTTLGITYYGMMDPVVENRITFSEKYLDRFGMPQITIDFRYGSKDSLKAAEMLGELVQIASSIGTYIPVPRAPSSAGPALQPPGTSFHIMGTYRLGDKEEDSVIDCDSRVWGVDNLHLGGPGVIGNPMASNPTLTAVAIAVKGACAMLETPIEALEKQIDAER